MKYYQDFAVRSTLLAAFLALLALPFCCIVSAAPSYTVTQIPLPAGYNSVSVSSININDIVCGDLGFVAGDQERYRSYVYSGGVFKINNPLPKYLYAFVSPGCYAINDQGLYVGYAQNKTGETAFACLHGKATSIMPAEPDTIAVCVNDSNLIAGDYESYLFLYQYPAGTVTTVPTLSTGDQALVGGMNNEGEVVGLDRSSSNAESNQGFLYSNGAVTALPVPTGTEYVYPVAINNSHVIAGNLYPNKGNARAALLRNGVWRKLPAPNAVVTYAAALNNAGSVVGEYTGQAFKNFHGFVFTDGSFYDLNDLIDPSLGYTIDGATSINNSGQITAGGTASDGTAVALILTPATD